MSKSIPRKESQPPENIPTSKSTLLKVLPKQADDDEAENEEVSHFERQVKSTKNKNVPIQAAKDGQRSKIGVRNSRVKASTAFNKVSARHVTPTRQGDSSPQQ